MSELHAALGLLTLTRIEEALERRMTHLAAYHKRLDETPGITFQRVRGTDRSTHKDLALLFHNQALRDHVDGALSAASVQTKRYFRPCHDMDAYVRYRSRPLPHTEDVYQRILCVPLFEGLTEDEIDLVSNTILTAIHNQVRS